ncbi:PREDICTED: transcription factor grauzone-like [Bactrocera latifrons]|uniref:Transcription factor grauzone n=1 Tax=Bactrocera latifrons TaxID=174628 RepID=A0A0K8UTR1_BACLA|nr:PREDICTED: transcription factor grauzone-like [Bactrocera latifrons]
MLCRLCISDCDHNSLELFDSGGKNTAIYNVVAKYFENEIKNMDEVKAELDAEQCHGAIQHTSQVICTNCWRHIDDFHQWQKELVILKDERLKLLQQPYQRELVESVKLEMEIDVNNLNIYEESFADDTCDNDDYFNEDTEDPVAICEAKLSTSPKKLPPDVGIENVANDDNDSLYDDMPLLRRRNLRQTKTSAPTKKKAGRRKKLKKVVVKKASDVDTDLDYNENEDKDEANSVEKVKEKSSKTREFDAFIAQHFKDKLPCELCGHLSADFTELRTHFREVHNNNKGYVLCCKHKYSQRFHFVEHLQVHLNPQKFQCAECGKCSANGRSLVAHMNSMHKPESLERRFECEVCHKKFAKLPILKTHMETHAEGNPDHICKECGKGFILESRLNIHIRNVHSTAYHSVCDQCGKSFRGRYALKYHLLEHDGAGKQLWPCDQCDAKLHSKFSLKRHKRITHHDGSTVYVCGECGKVALTEDALKSHKRYVHQRERIHKCTVCDKAFKASKVLKEHMTTHTGEDLYQCPHCPRTFKVNANMHHHRKRKHPKEWAENRRHRPMSFKHMDLNAISNEVVL